VLLERFLGPVERLTYRVVRTDPAHGQDWKAYARSVLIFSGLFWLALYLILRTQTLHPFNPEGFHSGTWDVTFNTTGRKSISASGPQGFSENLYAYLSQANNNGSAWAGYTGYVQPKPGNIGAHGVTFADLLGGLTMVFARFAPIIFVLAVAGALARKRVAPVGLGTMRTDTPTFVVLLMGVIVLVGALTFLPAILLGPVVQSLTTNLF
jgi:K+-transporting ATPase ATPase A chain